MKTLIIKTSLSFLRTTISDKLTIGKNIINGVTLNAAKLPNLPHSIAHLTTANTDLDNHNQTASGGDRALIAQKRATEKAWDGMFRDTANYVSYIASSDKGFIESCGFEPTSSEGAPMVACEPPYNFMARPAMHAHNAVALSCDAQTKARSNYIFALAPENATVLQTGNTIKITTESGDVIYIAANTRRKVVIGGIPSGAVNNAYVAAFNKAGTSGVTGPVRVIAM
jgi:hypothetical protein